ncbi:MAG: transcriptional regulator [Leptospiraceae bacterium]|nr:transcriptional regulator [Leptospiraceae bacterium]MCP5494362.1 transcriptional regulator [Leptospiraceae bacterium]
MHGVGEVKEITKKLILGEDRECYCLEIQNTRMKVMIPVEKVRDVGIRGIISKDEINRVLELLQKDEIDPEEDWKIRYQNNMNKIKSGSIFEVADVCRNLFRRANGKELSIMERKLYENAYNLVKTEIALSNGISPEESGNLVSDVLANSLQGVTKESALDDKQDMDE